MIRQFSVVALAAVAFTLGTSSGSLLMGQDEEAAEGETANIGYFLGYSIGQQMSQQGFQKGDFQMEAIGAGVADALANGDPQMTDEQMQAAAGAIEQMLRERQAAKAKEMQSAGAANLEKSKLFLEQNSKKEGIQTMKNGLQYTVVEAGEGESPAASDTVRVHYTGKLINGTVFDSSVERGQPAEFQVNQVIPGWQAALKEMKVGAKWKLFIPPGLAYGSRGAPSPPGQEPVIGPNEALIFDVELIDIVK
jgi:FKBP-type peptidyl-prolyl cis-trans isomerase